MFKYILWEVCLNQPTERIMQVVNVVSDKTVKEVHAVDIVQYCYVQWNMSM